MKNIFFSQSFQDKSNEDVFEECAILKTYFKKHFGVDVEILNQHYIEPPKDAVPTYNWAVDLLMLGEADLVVFCHNWEESLDCQMEMLACKKYNFPFMILPKLTLWNYMLRDLEKWRYGC